MTKLHIDPLVVLETFQRLIGANAFLEVVDEAIPAMDWEQGEALRHFFEEQGWDFGDYDVERQVHDAKFNTWFRCSQHTLSSSFSTRSSKHSFSPTLK